ncbi:DUF4236 domain-containing protein [Clostridium sp. UBA3887]|uniref:DUF4236 domain-containing protein n=1 Tax=Clostridium sp. UBA3887 TaxID=1946356 RepID=UPI0032171B58
MGFRFRKSKNFGPFRINISKSGIGWSVGGKGFRYTKRADGKTQTTTSIPGTGLSYVNVNNKRKSNSQTPISNNNINNFNGNNNNKPPFYKSVWFMYLMLFLLPPLGILILLFHKGYSKKKRGILAATFAVYALIMYTPSSPTINNNRQATSPHKIEQNSTVLAEQKAKEEEDKKAKAEEEAKIAAEKKAKEEEQAKLAAEQKAKEEEQAKLVAEQKAKEEEQARLAAEQKAKEVQPTTVAPSPKVTEPVQEQAPVQNSVKVYIAGSGNGTKYHSNPNCSNMKNPVEVNLSDIQNNYGPCKKCY